MAFHFSGIRLAPLWLPHILMLSKCYKEEPKIDTGYSAAAVPFKKKKKIPALKRFTVSLSHGRQNASFPTNFRVVGRQSKHEALKGFLNFLKTPSVSKHGTFSSILTLESVPRHMQNLDHFKVFSQPSLPGKNTYCETKLTVLAWGQMSICGAWQTLFSSNKTCAIDANWQNNLCNNNCWCVYHNDSKKTESHLNSFSEKINKIYKWLILHFFVHSYALYNENVPNNNN